MSGIPFYIGAIMNRGIELNSILMKNMSSLLELQHDLKVFNYWQYMRGIIK